ncbi:DUF1206 domain-containing protein [Novosphingobium profundi]|uniref:DUF1206 domain-containing protein n=1 Tax=Novosphingobium profundi TaxID=1774954 RepID=UPI001BDA2925|nr:DUF1206 domain-containing protein [Novosphingobium profundi]MBT0669023.1 DUF1206 domain-containing protein [Novosphingobium profundi]
MIDKSEKMVWLARLGFVARGVVYALLGYLALSSPATDAVRSGQAGILGYIQDIPGGSALLFAAAAGLLGYALFRLCSAFLDIENHGTGAKGIAARAGHFFSALVHLALAWSALQFAIGSKQSAGDNTHDMVAGVVAFQLGPVVLALAGIALITAALFQAREAVTLDFMKRVSSRAPSWSCWLGRAGYAARAIVYALIGWSLLRTAWSGDSREARSLGDAIMDLRELEPAHVAVAIGLCLFGLFSLIIARYRIIPDPGRKLDAARNAIC